VESDIILKCPFQGSYYVRFSDVFRYKDSWYIKNRLHTACVVLAEPQHMELGTDF
jgi:hypothetical protein